MNDIHFSILPTKDLNVTNLIESIQNENLGQIEALSEAHLTLINKKIAVKYYDNQYHMTFLHLAALLDKSNAVKLLLKLEPLMIFELDNKKPNIFSDLSDDMRKILNNSFNFVLSTLLSNRTHFNKENAIDFIKTLPPRAERFEDWAKVFVAANLLKLAYPDCGYTFDGYSNDAKERLQHFIDVKNEINTKKLSDIRLDRFLKNLPSVEVLLNAIEQDTFNEHITSLLTLKPPVKRILPETKPCNQAPHQRLEPKTHNIIGGERKSSRNSFFEILKFSFLPPHTAHRTSSPEKKPLPQAATAKQHC